MISYGILATLSERLKIDDFNVFFIDLILAVVLLVVGIFVGKVVGMILKKGFAKANLKRNVRSSFLDLIVVVVKWALYILFLSLALEQLGIPELTNWLTSVLVVIPALVGALVLIAVGFAIAVYLRDLIEESGILGWKILSMIFFYFIIYVFSVYALKTAMISQSKEIVDNLVLIFTAVVSAAVAWWHVKGGTK